MSMILGLIIALATIVFATEGGAEQFLRPHSIVVVFGGCLAMFFMTVPPSLMRRVFARTKNLFVAPRPFTADFDELKKMSRGSWGSVSPGAHTLIGYASSLVQEGLDEVEIPALIFRKRDELISSELLVAQCVRSLAKYPPALGMVGTVIGMITTFSSMGDKRNDIGVHLSVAMTATFFGLLIANYILNPLADRLQIEAMKQRDHLIFLAEALVMMRSETPPEVVESEIRKHVA